MSAPVLTYPFEASEPRTFADLDLVRNLQPVMTEGEEVPAGTRGTVVAIYAPGGACEVEFEAGIAAIEAGLPTAA